VSLNLAFSLAAPRNITELHTANIDENLGPGPEKSVYTTVKR